MANVQKFTGSLYQIVELFTNKNSFQSNANDPLANSQHFTVNKFVLGLGPSRGVEAGTTRTN